MPGHDDLDFAPDDSPDPPDRRKIFILWRERQWRRFRASERMARVKLTALYLTGAAALAAIASFALANWPGKKG